MSVNILNMNIYKTNDPIAITFYLKHHWGGRKAAFGFGADRFRPLVSIATDCFHRVIMGKTVSPHFLGCFYPILFILAHNKDVLKISDEFEIRPDPTTHCGVSCP